MSQGRGQITDLLSRYGVSPRRSLGQHFLADPNTVRRIVAFAGIRPGDLVVEIGAGTGTLTAALAAAGASVVAYEIDRSLEPLLRSEVGDQADLRFVDAARVDLASELRGEPWALVANLPYGVGTSLLLDAITGVGQITRFAVMMQREVADRLVAGPGSKTYGLPSVVAQLYCTVEFGFAVGPKVFVPPPNVDSAVVRLTRIAAPDAHRSRAIELASTAFGQRRKMLRSSLGGVVAAGSFAAAGIDPKARPEQLAPQDFLELVDVA